MYRQHTPNHTDITDFMLSDDMQTVLTAALNATGHLRHVAGYAGAVNIDAQGPQLTRKQLTIITRAYIEM